MTPNKFPGNHINHSVLDQSVNDCLQYQFFCTLLIALKSYRDVQSSLQAGTAATNILLYVNEAVDTMKTSVQAFIALSPSAREFYNKEFVKNPTSMTSELEYIRQFHKKEKPKAPLVAYMQKDLDDYCAKEVRKAASFYSILGICAGIAICGLLFLAYQFLKHSAIQN